MTLTSPLRYPGSKHQLSRYVQDVLELNRLHPTLYVEPFVGGASIALHMLQLPSVKQVILFCWGAFGGALPVAVVWSLFWANVLVKGITTLLGLPAIYLVKGE